MEREKDRGICLFRDKRNLQEHHMAFKCPENTVFSGTFYKQQMIDTTNDTKLIPLIRQTRCDLIDLSNSLTLLQPAVVGNRTRETTRRFQSI